MDKRLVAASLAAVVIASSQSATAFAQNVADRKETAVTEAYKSGPDARLRYARELFEHGMYVKAREIFSGYPHDMTASGYAVLCDVKMQSNGYETKLKKYNSENKL